MIEFGLFSSYLTVISRYSWLDRISLPSQIFSHLIKDFDSNIFDKYIAYRGDPLVGSIEQGMLLGEYRWEDNIDVKGAF